MQSDKYVILNIDLVWRKVDLAMPCPGSMALPSQVMSVSESSIDDWAPVYREVGKLCAAGGVCLFDWYESTSAHGRARLGSPVHVLCDMLSSSLPT